MQSNMSERALEMFALVESYYSGAASQKSFCEAEGLKLCTFQYWVTRYKKHKQQDTSQSHQRFIELQPQVPVTHNVIELRYPNGVTLSLSVLDIRLIKELIQF